MTLCLNHMNTIITRDTLNKYKRKVTELMKANIIDSQQHKVILNIILLLNFPHWREENVTLIIHCLSLLKNHLHILNVNELLIIYKVKCNILATKIKKYPWNDSNFKKCVYYVSL